MIGPRIKWCYKIRLSIACYICCVIIWLSWTQCIEIVYLIRFFDTPFSILQIQVTRSLTKLFLKCSGKFLVTSYVGRASTILVWIITCHRDLKSKLSPDLNIYFYFYLSFNWCNSYVNMLINWWIPRIENWNILEIRKLAHVLLHIDSPYK